MRNQKCSASASSSSGVLPLEICLLIACFSFIFLDRGQIVLASVDPIDGYVKTLKGRIDPNVPSVGDGLTEYLRTSKALNQKEQRLKYIEYELSRSQPTSLASRHRDVNQVITRLKNPEKYLNTLEERERELLESAEKKYSTKSKELIEASQDLSESTSAAKLFKEVEQLSADIATLYKFTPDQLALYRRYREKMEDLKELKGEAKKLKTFRILPPVRSHNREELKRTQKEIEILSADLESLHEDSQLPFQELKALQEERTALKKEISKLEMKRDKHRSEMKDPGEDVYQLRERIRKRMCRVSPEYRKSGITHCSPEEGGGAGHPTQAGASTSRGTSCGPLSFDFDHPTMQTFQDSAIAISHLATVDPELAERLMKIHERLKFRAGFGTSEPEVPREDEVDEGSEGSDTEENEGVEEGRLSPIELELKDAHIKELSEHFDKELDAKEELPGGAKLFTDQAARVKWVNDHKQAVNQVIHCQREGLLSSHLVKTLELPVLLQLANQILSYAIIRINPRIKRDAFVTNLGKLNAHFVFDATLTPEDRKKAKILIERMALNNPLYVDRIVKSTDANPTPKLLDLIRDITVNDLPEADLEAHSPQLFRFLYGATDEEIDNQKVPRSPRLNSILLGISDDKLEEKELQHLLKKIQKWQQTDEGYKFINQNPPPTWEQLLEEIKKIP